MVIIYVTWRKQSWQMLRKPGNENLNKCWENQEMKTSTNFEKTRKWTWAPIHVQKEMWNEKQIKTTRWEKDPAEEYKFEGEKNLYWKQIAGLILFSTLLLLVLFQMLVWKKQTRKARRCDSGTGVILGVVLGLVLGVVIGVVFGVACFIQALMPRI